MKTELTWAQKLLQQERGSCLLRLRLEGGGQQCKNTCWCSYISTKISQGKGFWVTHTALPKYLHMEEGEILTTSLGFINKKEINQIIQGKYCEALRH